MKNLTPREEIVLNKQQQRKRPTKAASLFKPGDRTITLQGTTHDITGGYWQCNKCKAMAGDQNALSTLCLEGTCARPNTQTAAKGEHKRTNIE